MTELELIINKIDSKVKLSEKEIEWLLWETEEISVERREPHRWNTPVSTVVKALGRYFQIDWWEANTECQMHFYDNQPYEVEPYEETIVVTKYRKI